MARKIGRTDWALLMLRLALGFCFAVIYGWPKLLGGVPRWEKLGSNMSHIGITWMPVFWGFMAMFAEFFGGICILLGIFVRPAAVLILITMEVAITALIIKGHPYTDMAENFEVCGGLFCLLIAGGGNLSLKGILKR